MRERWRKSHLAGLRCGRKEVKTQGSTKYMEICRKMEKGLNGASQNEMRMNGIHAREICTRRFMLNAIKMTEIHKSNKQMYKPNPVSNNPNIQIKSP